MAAGQRWATGDNKAILIIFKYNKKFQHGSGIINSTFRQEQFLFYRICIEA